MVLKTAVTFKDDVIKLIRLREAKSANFMHFHFADNRTVQEEKNFAYKNNEVLVVMPKNDLEGVCDTHNNDPQHSFCPRMLLAT